MLQKLTSSLGLPEDLFDLPLKSLNIGYCKKLPLDVIDTICQKLPQLEELYLYELEMAVDPTKLLAQLPNCTIYT